MFRNQYLISTKKVGHSFTNFREEKFGNLNLYLEPKLAFHSKSFKDLEVGFIGVFFDPLNPNQLIESLLDNFLYPNADLDSFFKNIEKLTGRFIALFKKNDSYYITGDFKNGKNIFYSFHNEFTVVTSSLKLYYELFKDHPKYDEKLKEFFESKLFLGKQQDWFGDKTIDVNFKRLLPNHYLNLSQKGVLRIPLNLNKKSFEEVLENCFQILRGTYEYLIKHHKILQPLTAGWDSRLLLGASLPYKDSIQYYIFRRPDNAESSDIILSQKIGKELNLNFSVFDVEEFKEDFIKAYKSHNLSQNLISKVQDIQYHYEYHRHVDNLVNVSGVSGNLLRYVFGSTNKIIVDKKDLYCLNAYGPDSRITTKEIDLWYDNAVDYAKSNNISILDLFYIENRAANWGSIYPHEQDIALEEIDPFNNKSLMFQVMQLNSKYRGFDKNQLSWKLLEKFDQSVCRFPLNPHRSALRMLFYKNFETHLLYRKFKFIQARYYRKKLF